VDRLTKLDRIAIRCWPVMVALIVGSAVYMIAERWPAHAEQYVTPVIMLALLLTYGLITMLLPGGSRMVPSRHE
jgi:hypothetical protein